MGAIDVAVVGGGLSGAYVAYRLTDLRPDWSVSLFESTARVGGRLLSVRAPGVSSASAEMGGMRFRSSQVLMRGITEELGLGVRPFPIAHGENRYVLRGADVRADDISGVGLPYDPAPPYEALSPGEVVLAVFEAVVPGAAGLTPEGWLEVRKSAHFKNRPLREWGLRELLRDQLGEDGYRYVADTFGYTTVLDDWNAADAMPWLLIETRPDSENQTLVEGMERLPRALVGRFVAQGGELHRDHHLVALTRAEDDSPGAYDLTFSGVGTRRAERVVLALPPVALGRLSQRSPPLALPHVRRLLSSVAPRSAAKVFLRYGSAWWRGGTSALRVVSGGPLQKSYYFDGPGQRPDEPALLLASYCDGGRVDGWRALGGAHARPDDDLEYESPARWDLYRAPDELVAHAHEHVRRLHPHTHVPPPQDGAFVDWGLDDYGGAYHLWEVGVRSWEVKSQILQPTRPDPLFICGEGYSSWQGWMEGALETADAVVQVLTRS